MNKIMKKWGTAVFTALTLCLGFSACADDDAITLNTASIKEAPDLLTHATDMFTIASRSATKSGPRKTWHTCSRWPLPMDA